MTGGYDEQTLRSLSEMLNPSRLAQLLGQLQRTGADLGRSANRRVDAELCLIRLCDESLDESAAGLNARMARLEALAVIGNVTSCKPAPPEQKEEPSGEENPAETKKETTKRPEKKKEEPPGEQPAPAPEKAPEPVAPQPAVPQPEAPQPAPQGEETPPWNIEPPPQAGEPTAPAESGQAPLPSPPAPKPAERRPAPPPRPSLPSGAWGDLVASLRGRVPMGEYSFLANPTMVWGTMDGPILTLWAQSDFVRHMISKPGTLAIIEKAAQTLPGAPYRVTVKVGAPPVPAEPPAEEVFPAEGPEDEDHDKLDDLLDTFGDIITTEEE